MLFILLLLLYSWYSYTQSLDSKTINWDNLEKNVNDIELNFNQLKIDNESLQIQLIDASTLLKEQIEYTAQQQLRSENLEIRLEKQEKSTKIWKNCFIVSTTIAVVTTITTVVMIKLYNEK